MLSLHGGSAEGCHGAIVALAMTSPTPAQLAENYEREASNIAPFHSIILDEVVEVALAAAPAPRRWLDTGCGPGRLVSLARTRSPETTFFLADPTEPMLSFSRGQHPDLPTDRFIHAPSHALPDLEPFDVITAVLCHHFYREEAAHTAALRRCRSLLRPGGVFVTVEIVRAETDAGHALQRRRWEEWQRNHGRAPEQIKAFMSNENIQYFPMRPSALGASIETVGFTTIEMFWRAYSLAGFLAIAAELQK